MFNFAIARETLSALMTGKYLSKRTSIIRLSYFCASLLEFYASISSFREDAEQLLDVYFIYA